MKSGINEIGEARLCTACQLDMAAEYVMRCMGNQRQDLCDRCGKVRPVTLAFKYTMKGKEKVRRGLI
jgi:hypothetical protein